MLIPLPGGPRVSAAGAASATPDHAFVSQRGVAPCELGRYSAVRDVTQEDANALTAVVSCPHNMRNMCGPRLHINLFVYTLTS